MEIPKPLDALTATDRPVLMQYLRTVRFRSGQCIFRAGSPGDGCYVIEEGDVRLEFEGDGHIDTERVLGYSAPGTLLGELALLDDLPRSVTAYAETDVTAQHLSAAAVEELCLQHPRIGVSVLRALGRDASIKLRRSTERVAEFIVADKFDPEVDRMVGCAVAAQVQLAEWSEERVDALLLALAQAVADQAEVLARATVKETRIGSVPDKVLKNVHASLGVYQYLVGKPGRGIIGSDPQRQVTEIASAAGVVFGIVPVTNPVATAIFKSLICLKARCALILSFHHACLGVGNAVCEVMQRALGENDAPTDLVQWVRQRSSRNRTAKFMSHPDVSLILATGGAGMVKAAYSSGTPAIGVGPGNTPVYVAADADIEAAARAIVASKPFDNGLICGAEHNLVVDAKVRDTFAAALERHGAAMLDPDEAKRFASGAIEPDGHAFVPKMIGQAAAAIADVVGITRSYPIKLIVVPAATEEVDRGTPLAHEKLAPLLSLFTVEGEEQALALCRGILAGQGAGHTAVIHTRSPERADRFGLAMPASRILVNSPAVQGIMGNTTGLVPSYTLGCGTFGGNSTTDNVTYKNLLNIKRLAHFTGVWE
jgi:acetaldehyde dehydrogenase/alcohol dehydrogenase